MAEPAMKAWLLALLLCSCFAVVCRASSALAHTGMRSSLSISDDRNSHWVDTWTSAPQSVTTGSRINFLNTTIRQTIPLSFGSEKVRLRLSNAYGSSDLQVGKITVALPQLENGLLLGSSSVQPQTLRNITFSSSTSFTIPAGALAVSDPVEFDAPLQAGQAVTLSIYLPGGQAGGAITSHVYSQIASFTAEGDCTESESVTNRGGPSWYFASAVEVWKSTKHKSLVAVGDSITDGRGSAVNANWKWPSLLSNRTQTTPGFGHISVVNQGIGGNQLLQDGIGPDMMEAGAVSRLNRDVLAQSGVGYVMIFEGINDIGQAAPDSDAQSSVETRMIESYKQIISLVHAFGIPVFGSTITPFSCADSPTRNRYAGAPTRERTRVRVNEWIRSSGRFDSVVDFDKVLRDPQDSTQMAPQFRGPDCLHPNANGYQALADNFPLEVFDKFKDGVSKFA